MFDGRGNLIQSRRKQHKRRNSCLLPLVKEFAPRWFFADENMILAACEVDESALQLADVALRSDARFLLSILTSGKWIAYKYVGVLRSTVDLFSKIDYALACRLFKTVVAWRELVPVKDRKIHLWTGFHRHLGVDGSIFKWPFPFTSSGLYFEILDRRDIAIAWLEAGMFFCAPAMRNYTADQHVFLTIARHCHSRWKIMSFLECKLALRDNIYFMKQAVSLDPILLVCASKRLTNDIAWVVHLVNMAPTLSMTFYSKAAPETLGKAYEHMDVVLQTLQVYFDFQRWSYGHFRDFHSHLWIKIYEYVGPILPERFERYSQELRLRRWNGAAASSPYLPTAALP